MKTAFLVSPRFSLGAAPGVSSTPSSPMRAHNRTENYHKRIISYDHVDVRSHPGTTRHIAILVGPSGRLDLLDSTYTTGYHANTFIVRRPLDVFHLSRSFHRRSRPPYVIDSKFGVGSID
jgi:hypothetical protein